MDTSSTCYHMTLLKCYEFMALNWLWIHMWFAIVTTTHIHIFNFVQCISTHKFPYMSHYNYKRPPPTWCKIINNFIILSWGKYRDLAGAATSNCLLSLLCVQIIQHALHDLSNCSINHPQLSRWILQSCRIASMENNVILYYQEIEV